MVIISPVWSWEEGVNDQEPVATSAIGDLTATLSVDDISLQSGP
jgi:hypothetical protein